MAGFLVTMPCVRAGDCQGRVVSLDSRVNNPVWKGKALLTIETEKAISTINCPATGLLRSYEVAPGDEVALGEVLAVLTGVRRS